MTTQNAIAPVQTIPALDLGRQYSEIQHEIDVALKGVLDSQVFILGPQVRALEEEISRYCGTRFAVAVASGTDALILSLHALGIGRGDEVIVPGFSFIASADSVSMLGATPVFADIDPVTFTISADEISSRVTDRTRAIIAVHLYGQTADMDPILQIARKNHLAVIEDNAQAIGAMYKGKKSGALGDCGCISFFPSKNLGAYGDGGMIVTNSEETYQRIRALRSHGSTKKYLSEELGWNSRLDELQAAVLRVKLRHLDRWSDARTANASVYDTLLDRVPGVLVPTVRDCCRHVFHQYTIRTKQRDLVQMQLQKRGIGSTVYYPTPLHLQPMYSYLKYGTGTLPHAERACAEVLSLPIYAELTRTEIEAVADAIASAMTS
jgi:dTDP-4-amino-4,6-dideoxygalactose transaminase